MTAAEMLARLDAVLVRRTLCVAAKDHARLLRAYYERLRPATCRPGIADRDGLHGLDAARSAVVSTRSVTQRFP